MTRHLWALLAWTCLVLGIVGAFVPVMPTVPFILLSAFAASRGSTRLRRWLLAHPKFGSTIVEWEQAGTVRRRNKWIATAMMTASLVGMLVFAPVWWLPAGVGAIMAITAVWLWLRPEPRA